MSAQTNRALMQSFAAQVMSVPFTPDAVCCDVAQGCTYSGRAAVQRFLHTLYVDGFEHAQIDVRCIAADESAVAMEYVLRGRQAGTFAGIPPTGRSVVLPMTIVCQICDGQVWRASLYYDGGTLLRQLGLAL